MRKEFEEWRTIENYPDYQVSDLGRVRNIKTGKVLKLHRMNIGYMQAGLTNEKGHKILYVHRLVANAFLDNPKNKKCVNHKNRVKYDNRKQNLEFCTRRENNLHARKTGFCKIPTHLTIDQEEEIFKIFENNPDQSPAGVAALFNVSENQIFRVLIDGHLDKAEQKKKERLRMERMKKAG